MGYRSPLAQNKVNMISNSIWFPIVVSIITLLYAFFLAISVKKIKVENERANEISGFIASGAKTFLKKEY